MKYVEFLVFIARVSHEVYLKGKEEHIGLHLKIDNVLGKLLETQFIQKAFTFKVEEENSDEGGDDDEMGMGSDMEDI